MTKPIIFQEDLEQTFGEVRQAERDTRLGVVVGGSLNKGLVVKLDRGQQVEDLAVGRYVIVHGESGRRFFCMITDIVLDNINPDIQNAPPDVSDPFLREIYMGTLVYGKINIQPMLVLETDDSGKPVNRPVKTIPSHFTRVSSASAQDVNDVFGDEDDNHFNVGTPLEAQNRDISINIDLRRMVERSVGVFGKSGTGKSFYTRMLLAGIIAKRQAVVLVFDMHNDYGWKSNDEGKRDVKGLKQVFMGAGRGQKISVCTLDPESSLNRNTSPDYVIRIAYSAIEPEDLAMLRESMGLTDAMLDAAHSLRKLWGPEWIRRLIDATADDIDEIEAKTPNRAGTINGLKRRVERFERWRFLVREAHEDSIAQILDLLIYQQTSVVLEFGKYGNSLEAYILVANYITRRIHEKYVELVEKALGNDKEKPQQLMIVIEEAHKFLDPKIADQTIFGIIARELRKYNVTLLVVDQRPSGIDEEVMSQIGTRVTALLDNERDIAAVLNGVSGAAGLRDVLARLDTKQQAIIMGHAVPMPVVIRTRDYNQVFYDAIRGIVSGRPLDGGPDGGSSPPIRLTKGKSQKM
jgi:hypothetical protein